MQIVGSCQEPTTEPSRNADKSETGYYALLLINRYHTSALPVSYANGAILSSTFVVTSAILEARYVDCYFDIFERDSLNMTRRVEKENIFTHEKYDGRNVREYNIALLKLADPIFFDNLKLAVIADPLHNFTEAREFFVGFGSKEAGGALQSDLWRREFSVIDNKNCSEFLTDEQSEDLQYLCAFPTVTNDTACDGDIGGPLVSVKHNQFVLVGLLTMMNRRCEPNEPVLFVKVNNFTSWIEDKTGGR